MANRTFSRLVRICKGDHVDPDGPLLEASLSRLEKFVHFWALVWKSFVRNRCPVRASALSYSTLLALIPMLAVAMSVSSVFLKSKGEDEIKTFISEFISNIAPMPAGTNAVPAGSLTDFDLIFLDDTNALAAVPVSANDARSVADTTTDAAENDKSVADTREVTDTVHLAQDKAASYVHHFIQNTYSGTLGVTGMVFLLVTAILMLTRIEETFNDIWGVSRGRNWLARVVLYWAAITLGPLLLVGALGLAGGPHMTKTRDILVAMPFFSAVISRLLPVAIVCFTFALFYKLMPNTRVDFSAALVGGVLAGTAWHLYNLLGFVVASRAVNASKIYGSLALVPLLMGGLYMVWLTVLFGAQVAYAWQNRSAYLQDKLVENVNQRGREFIALRLMTCVGQRYQRGLPPPGITDIATELGVPSRLIQQVVGTLLAARLVVEVRRPEAAYAPARPLDTINAHHILMAMRATAGQELVSRDEPVRAEVLGEFARIQEAEKAVASSVSMLALVNRADARLALEPPPAKPAPNEKRAKVLAVDKPTPVFSPKPGDSADS